MIVGLVTAVAASACYGVGSVLQAVGSRRSAREEAAKQAESGGGSAAVTGYGGPSLSSTAKAAVTWEFILGTILDFVGFGLGALAARLLPLFLSQTIISANLVVTAVLGIRLLGIKLHRADWTSIGVVCGALVLLGIAAGPEGDGHSPRATHWWVLIVTFVVIVGGTLLVRFLGANGAIVAGLLSGLGFGGLGIGVRILDGIDPFDLGELLADPALYAVLIGGIGGMYLHTIALQIGSVNGATAALVVGETVVPGAVGVLWLGDTSRDGLGWMAGLGFVLAVSGAVAVAYFGKHAPEEPSASAEPDPAAAVARG
ncbi:hypothetical protein [Embleya sp. NBC_00896]|uniref:hypothetical protein n=1 Tax=Embleya sp. NBC_00896 TaxID=2975961 RepID=UPI00386A9EFE|nr:hypothetical protein OG928_26960 [Embleya sp. NBC_00896]